MPLEILRATYPALTVAVAVRRSAIEIALKNIFYFFK